MTPKIDLTYESYNFSKLYNDFKLVIVGGWEGIFFSIKGRLNRVRYEL